jgi:hypothetical protein
MLRKFRKEKEPNYKELYEIEMQNRKLYEKRYREIEKQYRDLQKESGIAELRVKLTNAVEELAFVKEDRAKLYIELEDTRNELELERNKNKNGE